MWFLHRLLMRGMVLNHVDRTLVRLSICGARGRLYESVCEITYALLDAFALELRKWQLLRQVRCPRRSRYLLGTALG